MAPLPDRRKGLRLMRVQTLDAARRQHQSQRRGDALGHGSELGLTRGDPADRRNGRILAPRKLVELRKSRFQPPVRRGDLGESQGQVHAVSFLFFFAP